MGDIDTQRILESVKNRSKRLGMQSKILTENNVNITTPTSSASKSKGAAAAGLASPSKYGQLSANPKSPASSSNRNAAIALHGDNNGGGLSLVEKSTSSFNIDAKENSGGGDIAVEINITTGSNVQVQVGVEEQTIDADGNVLNSTKMQRKQITTGEPAASTSPPPSTPSTPFMRDSSRNQLNRLGALYSNPQDLSSPVHRTETAFTVEQTKTDITQSGTKLKTSNRLAKLANSINTWEDDTPRSILSKSSPQKGATAATVAMAAAMAAPTIPKRIEEKNENKNSNACSKSALKWDKKTIDSLEMQGYKRRDTTVKRLEYNFGVKTSNEKKEMKISNVQKSDVVPAKLNANREIPPAITKKVEVSTKGLVSDRAAIFNSQRTNHSAAAATSVQTNKKDPAEMSLKERMALFEKNKGEALIPKAALGMAPSARQIMADKKPSEIVKQIGAKLQPPVMPTSSASTVAPIASKTNDFNRPPKADTCASGLGIRQTVAKLQNAQTTISESRIADENRRIREQEMNVVLNRFNHQQQQEQNVLDDDDDIDDETPASPPPAPPMPKNDLFKSNSGGRKRLSDEHIEVSDDVRKSLEDIKRVKVNPPKQGHAYPALSDIESSGQNTPQQYTPEPPYTDDDNYIDDEDSYMDSEDDLSNVSANNANNRSGRHVHYDDIDEYLDEAMDSDEDADDEEGGAKRSGTISSESFSYQRKPLYRHTETIHEDEAISKFQSPIKSRLTVEPDDDDNSVTLTHTVSFYRRQQAMNSPSVRQLTHSQRNYNTESAQNGENSNHHTNDNAIDNDIDDDATYMKLQEDLVQKKIKSLMDSVMIQDQQIAQASNALNTCASTFEFSGSTESVVAEWKLLVATHSRKAALQEVQRLKIEQCVRPRDAPRECGRVTVKDIVLPLSDDYVRKVSQEKILGHHLVCLLKYNEHVFATKTYPTLPGLKSVKFPGELLVENAYADFKITLEIYGMIAQRESLPHDIKYHIKKDGKKGGSGGLIKTPKGKKGGSNLIMPPIQSPAGPNVVRTSAFAYYGFVIFSLREVQRNSWTLNQVAARDISPLAGTVYMKINCALTVDIDHKAFLTMFEDVSGFGAWHRRWCHLHGSTLSYWKYPDDERSKPPIGSLDLSVCEQTKISTAPRDMCARLNTLMIELKRMRRADDDEDSMLLQTKGEYTYVRHLLSADTKEDRDKWCNVFNKTLALMRAWGNSSEQQQQRRRSMQKI